LGIDQAPQGLFPKPPTTSKHQASSIKHQASSIKHQASSIKHQDTADTAERKTNLSAISISQSAQRSKAQAN
jgi:hypothetical protein